MLSKVTREAGQLSIVEHCNGLKKFILQALYIGAEDF